MGIVDRVFGRGSQASGSQEASSPDEQALQRYRYLVRTAPPEAIEEAHRDAFARLTPAQRERVLQELNAAAPPGERVTDPNRADPQTLARMATRAELRQPGTIERTLGQGTGPGLGGMFASSLMGSIVGSVIGSAIAHQFLGGFPHGPEPTSGDDLAARDTADDSDPGADDVDSGDVGDSGDFGDSAGGDFGEF
jgi:hypothetical protein